MLTRISNTPRDYAWGSPTLIARLEGREPTGAPEAEVWFGDHPGSPSVVHDGTGRTLDAWLPAEGERHGASPRLPFLLKLLAAGAPLSIQVHPSKEQAEEGFAREEEAGVPRDAAHRAYRDDNHKPELIVAVSERFEALAGLRDRDATLRMLAGLDDAPGVQELRGRLEGADASAALRATIGWLLSGDARAAVSEIIAAAAGATSEEFSAELRLSRALGEAYPGDPGVVVALLMNRVELRRGESIFVPAGVLHAYVAGLGVELMAASDNVLRGGLTPKHIDVDELLGLLDATPSEPPILRPIPVAPGVELFDPGVPDFALAAVAVGGPAAEVALRGTSIALVTEGSVRIESAAGEAETLAPGEALLALEGDGPLRLSGTGRAFVATPGRA